MIPKRIELEIGRRRAAGAMQVRHVCEGNSKDTPFGDAWNTTKTLDLNLSGTLDYGETKEIPLVVKCYFSNRQIITAKRFLFFEGTKEHFFQNSSDIVDIVSEEFIAILLYPWRYASDLGTCNLEENLYILEKSIPMYQRMISRASQSAETYEQILSLLNTATKWEDLTEPLEDAISVFRRPKVAELPRFPEFKDRLDTIESF